MKRALVGMIAPRAETTLVEAPSSHAVMLSKPGDAADFIEMAAGNAN